MRIAEKVEGCYICGKPCALVGDRIPSDGMCPWCRAEESPGVTQMWLKEINPEPITKVENIIKKEGE